MRFLIDADLPRHHVMGGTSLSAAKGVEYTDHTHHYVLGVPHDE